MLEILGEQSINSLERAACSLGTVIVDVSGSEEAKDQRPHDSIGTECINV